MVSDASQEVTPCYCLIIKNATFFRRPSVIFVTQTQTWTFKLRPIDQGTNVPNYLTEQSFPAQHPAWKLQRLNLRLRDDHPNSAPYDETVLLHVL